MIEIPIPPSVNHLWRILRQRKRPRASGGKLHLGGGADRIKVVPSRQYQSWLEVAVPLLRIGLARASLPARVNVLIRGGKGWFARRDLDNSLKAILDAMVKAERLPDDSTQHVHDIRVRYLPPEPGLPACCEVGYQEDD